MATTIYKRAFFRLVILASIGLNLFLAWPEIRAQAEYWCSADSQGTRIYFDEGQQILNARMVRLEQREKDREARSDKQMELLHQGFDAVRNASTSYIGRLTVFREELQAADEAQRASHSDLRHSVKQIARELIAKEQINASWVTGF